MVLVFFVPELRQTLVIVAGRGFGLRGRRKARAGRESKHRLRLNDRVGLGLGEESTIPMGTSGDMDMGLEMAHEGDERT